MLCSGLSPRVYESLKTLCCLANAAGPLQAHEIAAAAGLPPAQTAKILQLMTWAGFIESRRGTKGGYWLVTPADHIRVTDVADFFTHHIQDNHPQAPDPLLKALARVTDRCQKEFAHITVADLAKVSGCESTGPHRVRRAVATPQSRKLRSVKNAAQQRSRR
jgi:Rrf2 family protein